MLDLALNIQNNFQLLKFYFLVILGIAHALNIFDFLVFNLNTVFLITYLICWDIIQIIYFWIRTCLRELKNWGYNSIIYISRINCELFYNLSCRSSILLKDKQLNIVHQLRLGVFLHKKWRRNNNERSYFLIRGHIFFWALN